MTKTFFYVYKTGTQTTIKQKRARTLFEVCMIYIKLFKL